MLESSFGFSNGEKIQIFGKIQDNINCGNDIYPQMIVDSATFCPCCKGMTGNVNYDPQDIVDISDLVELIDYMFSDGHPGFKCPTETDVNGDSFFDISDIVTFVDYMFNFNFTNPLAQCPFVQLPPTSTYEFTAYDSLDYLGKVFDYGTIDMTLNPDGTISGTYSLNLSSLTDTAYWSIDLTGDIFGNYSGNAISFQLGLMFDYTIGFSGVFDYKEINNPKITGYWSEFSGWTGLIHHGTFKMKE